ncbi:MAG: galactose oxidase-like domain-containing protein, partial [Pseudomonadota bacterium]
MNALRSLARVSVFFGVLVASSPLFADYNYEYYEGSWSVLPDFDLLTAVETGTTADFDIDLRNRDSQYAFRFTGTITAAEAADYTFFTSSDDGSQLFIDGTLVVDNDGLHGVVQQNGTISLTAGDHDIVVTFFQQGGGQSLSVAWAGNGQGQQPIPADGVIGVPPDLSAVGQWGPVLPWPHVAVSAANLPDGRILTWSGSERDTWPRTEQTYSATWDPTTGEFIEVFHEGHNMFCAHLAMAEDGRVFVNGGRNTVNSPWTSLFDFRDNSWEQIENMTSGGRWYPTTLALSDGDMFTAIGTATNPRNPDRWDPVTGWQIQDGIDFDAMVLDDYFSTGSHGESRWWPLLHVAPNGKIFHSGPTPQMHWINTAGSGSFEPVGDTFTDWYHKHGTTIMYEEGKLLTSGGWVAGNSITSTSQAFTVDLNGAMPVVELTQPMAHARKFHNGIMLPTGEVLVVGGNTSGRKFSDDGAILVTEIWNPDTGTWREGAAMTIPRNYHSIALLLNDGRVLAAGSGYNSNSVPASTHQDGQVYSPPYLFNADGTLAARPAITGGAGIVETGATFNVTTSEDIEYFSMIKMSSTTHGMNTDVRYLRPQFAAAGAGSYDVTLHGNPNVATPGYWMLFAVNANGTPSEAHVIRVTAVDTRLENRALQGTVSQSSTATGAVDFGAANAIDGDLSGDETIGSLAQTGADTNAWWEVDLGQELAVEQVRLWARTDCCAEQLADFYVLVSAEPFVSQDLSAVLAQPGVRSYFHSGVASRQTDRSIVANGRYVRIQKANAGPLAVAEVQVFAGTNLIPEPELVVERGVVEDVGSTWQTVNLEGSYSNPVVIATARYSGEQLPAVTRVRNAGGNSFELRVQNPSNAPLIGYGVNYMVAEAGVYDTPEARFEAVLVPSTQTDFSASWVGEAQSYQLAYTNPVVVGQVMSANDDAWSVFWASDGTTGNPPSATSLSIGKHVAEDTNVIRAAETLGYIVFESGQGTIGNLSYQAGVGENTIEGVVEPAAPYNYTLLADYDSAVVSSAGMNGLNGGWPVMVGPQLAGSTLSLGVDEDQISDPERVRIDDQAAFVAMANNTQPLEILTIDTLPVISGADATLTVVATGPSELTYSWSVDGIATPFSSDPTFTFSFDSPGRHLVTVTVRDADGNEVRETFTQLVHLPAMSAGTPSHSGTVVEIPTRGEVWVANPDNDSVTIIDTAMMAAVAEVPVSAEPRAISVAPDGRVWVVSKAASMINIIDPATRAIVDMVFFDVGTQPHGLAMSSSTAYVVLEATGEVVSLSAFDHMELARTTLGGRPRHVSVNPQDGGIYVSQFVTPTLPGEATASPEIDSNGGVITVLDAATLATVDTIVLQHSDRQVSEHSGPGVPNYVGPAVVSPDGTSAWVPSKQDNILAGALRGGPGLTFDQTVRAIASRIALPARDEDFAMRVDLDNASVASHAAFDPFGIHLFTALEGNREIAVIDVFSGVELSRFDTGFAPQAVTVSDDGSRLYVHNFMSRSVGIYDVSDLVYKGEISAPLLETVSTVSTELLPPQVLLGKQLFYDARDDRLAALDYMSCASCHNEGSDDGRVWDFTGVGEGLRNTISLNGRSGMGHGFLHWSANFDEVQDFEAQIRDFAGGTGLMDNADYFAGTRSEPLGDAKAGLSPDLDALAAYVASLDAAPISPHRGLDREFDAVAQTGVEVFRSSGCDSCHTPRSMTDSSDGAGLHDVGTILASSGNRLAGPLTGIDTPTLLGAWKTAPYLHDGSAATLEEAIVAHQDVVLTDLELGQLAAMIRQLDDGRDLLEQTGPQLAAGTVENVTAAWQTVTLDDTYVEMVVIATIQQDASQLPVVTRVRNVSSNSFDVMVQNPSGNAIGGYAVHYLVAESGVYNVDDHGIAMEAQRVTSTATSFANASWNPESITVDQSYVAPIVVGQVMTTNDPRWSVFWSSDGVSHLNPPSSAGIAVGKHVGEDSDQARNTETLGVIVMEAG